MSCLSKARRRPWRSHWGGGQSEAQGWMCLFEMLVVTQAEDDPGAHDWMVVRHKLGAQSKQIAFKVTKQNKITNGMQTEDNRERGQGLSFESPA